MEPLKEIECILTDLVSFAKDNTFNINTYEKYALNEAKAFNRLFPKLNHNDQSKILERIDTDFHLDVEIVLNMMGVTNINETSLKNRYDKLKRIFVNNIQINKSTNEIGVLFKIKNRVRGISDQLYHELENLYYLKEPLHTKEEALKDQTDHHLNSSFSNTKLAALSFEIVDVVYETANIKNDLLKKNIISDLKEELASNIEGLNFYFDAVIKHYDTAHFCYLFDVFYNGYKILYDEYNLEKDYEMYLTKSPKVINTVLRPHKGDKQITSVNQPQQSDKPKRKYAAIYYAFYHWVLIEMGKEKAFEKNRLDKFPRATIENFAENRYKGVSPQQFYVGFRDIDITRKEALAKEFGKGYKAKLIDISGNDAEVISHLKNYPS